MMTAAAVLPLAFAGLSLISLSMRRHARDAALAGNFPWLRGLGWAAALLSLAVVLAASNWRFALVEWTGLVVAAAALVVLALYRHPRSLPFLAAGGGLIGVAAGLVLLVSA